jgi:uncharacterized membrane protein YuzA (DUF378 family)
MFHHILGKIAWAVTALAAINIGFIPFGHDFFMADMFVKNPDFRTGAFYFIGICGVYSLVKMFMHVMGYCDHCKKK